MKRTVLIPGGAGFLGGHISNAFSVAGWRTVGIGRSEPVADSALFDAFIRDDLSAVSRLEPVLDRWAPDAVVHLAAPSSVPQSIQDPIGDFLAHAIPTITLFEAIRRSRLDARIILASSAAVYGEPRSLPIAESAPVAPISPYGFHKLQQEILVDEYTNIHGLRCCRARIFSTYGENLRRLAVWEIARRASRGDYRIYGSGDETRDYLYVGDVADAIVCIAENAACRGEAINVASGESVTIRALAEAVFATLGVAAVPKLAGAPLPGNPIHWRADVTRLHNLGFSPHRWSYGLPRVIDWIRRQPG